MDEACEVGALSPTEIKLLLFDCGQNKRMFWSQDNENGLEGKTDSGPNTKGDATEQKNMLAAA